MLLKKRGVGGWGGRRKKGTDKHKFQEGCQSGSYACQFCTGKLLILFVKYLKKRHFLEGK